MKLLDIITKYINKEVISNASYDEELLNISLEQSLQTLLYPTTKVVEYKKHYISWVVKQEQFYALQNEITAIFNSNNIKHIYFKGSVLSKLYDDPSVRTRGDIDLYVDIADFNKAKSLLLDNGYIIDTNGVDCTHHIGLIKNNIEVELHFNMIDSDRNKKWINLFKNPFKLSNLENESLYKLNDTYHFIYCLIHFASHLRHGAGIRYILDFYYMLNKTNIDFILLHKEIKRLDIEVLYNNVINAIDAIIGIRYDNEVAKEDVTFFIDYMMMHGIHGHSNNETSMASSIHHNKLKYFFNRVFLLDKNYRKTRYEILGAHWYLYPICLIKHWLWLITHKLKSFLKFLFGKNKNKKIYKKLGV